MEQGIIQAAFELQKIQKLNECETCFRHKKFGGKCKGNKLNGKVNPCLAYLHYREGGRYSMCNCMKIREEIARNHFEGNRKENETLIDCNISDSHMVLKDGGRRMQHQTVSTVKVLYQKLGRSGNIQSKNKEFKFGHKYCPFCGEPYEKVYVENQDDIDAIRNTLFAMKKLIEQGELFSQEIDNQMNFALQAVSSLEELKRAVNVAMGGGDKNEQKS